MTAVLAPSNNRNPLTQLLTSASPLQSQRKIRIQLSVRVNNWKHLEEVLQAQVSIRQISIIKAANSPTSPKKPHQPDSISLSPASNCLQWEVSPQASIVKVFQAGNYCRNSSNWARTNCKYNSNRDTHREWKSTKAIKYLTSKVPPPSNHKSKLSSPCSNSICSRSRPNTLMITTLLPIC